MNLKFGELINEPVIYISIAIALASFFSLFRKGKIHRNKLIELAMSSDLEGFKTELNKTHIDINQINLDGYTPLIAATIKFGRKYLIEELIERGAFIDWQDISGNTALHYAVIGKRKAAIRALIDHQANCQIENKEGKTAVNIAQELQDNSILQLLIPSSKL